MPAKDRGGSRPMATIKEGLLLLAPESPAFCFMRPCMTELVNKCRDWRRKGQTTRRGWSQDVWGLGGWQGLSGPVTASTSFLGPATRLKKCSRRPRTGPFWREQHCGALPPSTRNASLSFFFFFCHLLGLKKSPSHTCLLEQVKL